MSTGGTLPRSTDRESNRFGYTIQHALQKIIQSLALHPYLLISCFILSLYTENVGQVYFWETYRSFWFSFLVVTVLLVLSSAVLRNWHKGGFLTSVILLLSFSYDHILLQIARSMQIDLTVLVLIVLGLWIWLFFTAVVVSFRTKKPFHRITYILNLTGLAFLAITILTLGFKFVNYQQKRDLVKRTSPALALNIDEQQSATLVKRDIYYIILDGYTREDVLNELYDLDTSDFLRNLEQQGFTIASQSSSNYAQTLLSLSSSLNMDYLQNMLELNKAAYSRDPVIELLQNNEVMGFLKKLGYRVVTLESGYSLVTLREADVFIPRRNQINAFESELIPGLWGNITNFQKYNLSLYREDQLIQFDSLKAVVDEPGPKFVFSHFLMPHPPFIFDRDGGPVYAEDFRLADGSHFTAGREAYRSGYREQVLFAEKKIQEVITSILSSYPAGQEPVIILQGDHGSGMYLDWESFPNSCARERLSILNAYYLPDGGQEALYPGISPVNSFRVIFNHYFHTELPLLPDEHYFSIWSNPYDLIPVSEERLARPCEAP